MLSLAREEALHFVNDRLDVQEVERKIREDKLCLLNEMISAFHNNIPFQTVTNMAIDPVLRNIPSVDEIKDDLFSGRGGMCTALNGFFNAVLLALGYDSYTTGGRMWNGDLFTHVIIIVRGVCRSKDVFLVDVGIGYPTLNAVPLDFEAESPTVSEMIWWGRFVRLPAEPGETGDCNPRFVRQRMPRYPAELRNLGFGHRELAGEWNNIYKFSLEPVPLEELFETVNVNIYKDVSHILSRTLRAIRWKNDRATAVINNHIFREEEDGQGHSVLLETDEDIAATIRQEFPAFDEDMVVTAIKQWRRLHVA